MFKTKEELHKERTTFDRENLSEQYAPVDTTLLLMPFTNKGWYVHKHRKAFNNEGFGWEQISLRNASNLCASCCITKFFILTVIS